MVAKKQIPVDDVQEPVMKDNTDCQYKDGRPQYDLAVIEKKQILTMCMINKAHDLLKAAGDGSGDLKIKQIEKAIEIYKAIQYA